MARHLGHLPTPGSAADRPTGRLELMAEITVLQAIHDALREEMTADERVFLIGEDIGAYGGAFKVTEGLLEEFGRTRVIDAPIAEAAVIGTAAGAAMCGMRPVAELQFIDF